MPSEWVEEATRLDTKTDPAAEYQYFWWIDEARDAYYAEDGSASSSVSIRGPISS